MAKVYPGTARPVCEARVGRGAREACLELGSPCQDLHFGKGIWFQKMGGPLWAGAGTPGCFSLRSPVLGTQEMGSEGLTQGLGIGHLEDGGGCWALKGAEAGDELCLGSTEGHLWASRGCSGSLGAPPNPGPGHHPDGSTWWGGAIPGEGSGAGKGRHRNGAQVAVVGQEAHCPCAWEWGHLSSGALSPRATLVQPNSCIRGEEAGVG